MNESAAMARRIADQLGDDLDRILTPATESPVVMDARPDIGIELRQIAGLTAGGAMRLSNGTYQFGQTDSTRGGLDAGRPSEVGFTLTIEGDEAVVSSGTKGVTLNGRPISEPTPVGDAVIEVGSARFVLAVPRRPVRRRQLDAETETVVPVERPIAIPDLTELQRSSETKPRPSIRTAFRTQPPSDPVSDYLTTLVLDQRDQVLARKRLVHPHPEEIMHRARNVRSVGWTRRATHPHFAQVAIALGDLPWKPSFDRPDRVPAKAAEAFKHLLRAPSVPVAADLQRGPLGIVGNRASALAVARSVMVALATLSRPEDLTIAVLADDRQADEWTWADRLPHNQQRFDEAFPVLVVDGLHHLTNPALDVVLSGTGEFGCVLIGDNVEELPSVCSSVLLIDDSGSAVIIDNRDGTTTMNATPLGLTPDLAEVAATALGSMATIKT